MAELRGELIHMEINTISAGLKGRCGTLFANKQPPFLSDRLPLLLRGAWERASSQIFLSVTEIKPTRDFHKEIHS